MAFRILAGRGSIWRKSARIFIAKSEVKIFCVNGFRPDQTEQYDKFQLFEVVGSDTGTRYRIRLGTTMNVEELAEPKSRSRRTGDQFEEKIVIVRGALS